MTRLFVDQPPGPSGELELSGEHAHYLGRVLRFQPGDAFVAVDPAGQAYRVVVERVTATHVLGRVTGEAELAAPPALRLDLYAALLKGQHFDLVIQKGTELGLTRLIPVITARAISRPDPERAGDKTGRWRKISLEACRQCGRADPPEVLAPLAWQAALEHWRAGGVPGLMACEVLAGSPGHGLRRVLEDLGRPQALAAFVGPEGGFSPREMEQGTDAGLRLVSLGPRILRAETAALALCAILSHETEPA
jgi:16S rRNA (uracil1498-N3)-methyltransferase